MISHKIQLWNFSRTQTDEGCVGFSRFSSFFLLFTHSLLLPSILFSVDVCCLFCFCFSFTLSPILFLYLYLRQRDEESEMRGMILFLFFTVFIANMTLVDVWTVLNDSFLGDWGREEKLICLRVEKFLCSFVRTFLLLFNFDWHFLSALSCRFSFFFAIVC